MASDNPWRRAALHRSALLKEAIRNLNESTLKIVLVVDAQGRLEGTVSDGDIRRGLLKGLELSSPIETVMHRNPLVVPPSFGEDMVMQLMRTNNIQQIPVVDDQQIVIGLHLWNAINVAPQRANMMVIMAGGKGTRLLPHTENCPKPMVPVAGKPMLQHIIERGRQEGFNNFVVALNYLGHMIEDYFGDGSAHGVRIEYLKEKTALGTAGALSLLPARPAGPFLVTNGDVITDIRYGELLDFHVRHGAMATMAVRVHEWQHPFGVVQLKGLEIVGFEEKPVARTYINAGVYVLAPEALQYLEAGAPCDMPTLFERLQTNAQRTVAYPMHEPWLDVGRPSDLLLAQNQIGKGSA